MVRENMRSPRAVLQFSLLWVGILQGGLVVRVRDLACGGEAVDFRAGRGGLVLAGRHTSGRVGRQGSGLGRVAGRHTSGRVGYRRPARVLQGGFELSRLALTPRP